MATAADYLRNELRKHIFRTGSFTKPATLYVALLTDATTEVTGGSYARAASTSSDADWTAEATAGSTKNASDITFPTASADWGVITHVAIYDASTAGNQLFIMAMAASVAVLNGATPKFLTGSLQFNVSG